MSGRSAGTVVILLAGISVALVIAAYMMMRPGASPRVAAADEPRLAPMGVGAAAVDPAIGRGRADADDEDDEAEGEDGAATPRRPEADGGREPDPRRGEPPPEPAPPVPPSAAAQAESAAVLAVRAQVQAEVAQAIESRRRALRNACWQGSASGSATLPLQASFGADGGLLALSIADDRNAPAELGACVRAQPLPLAIEPPGVGVTVDVPLTLP